MSASRNIQILDVRNVVAGGIAVVTCPRGYNYKKVIFTVGNTAAANVNAPALNTIIGGRIQMKAGGAIQRTVDPLQYAAIVAKNGGGFAIQSMAGNTNGLPNVNGAGRTEFTMYFEEPWRTRVRNNSVDPNVMGFRTGYLPETKPLQFYVPLAAGVTPVLSVVAEVDDDDNGTPSRLMKFFTEDEVVAGATANLMNLNKGVKPGDRFSEISVFNTSDAKLPVSVRLEIADTVVHEDIPVSTLRTLNRANGLDVDAANAIANGVHLVFDANDALDDTIPSNFSKSLLKIGLSAAAAGTMPYVIQRWGLPEGV